MKNEVATRPARVFRNGNSVAVRLPKGWAKAGSSLQIRQTRKGLFLAKDDAKPKTLADMLKRMRACGPDPGPFIREQPPYPKRDFLDD